MFTFNAPPRRRVEPESPRSVQNPSFDLTLNQGFPPIPARLDPTALPDGVMVLGKLRRLAGDFRRDRRANVAMIFAFLLIPVLFAAGMGVDYATAARRRAKLDSAADSAVLAAVTPSSMAMSSSNAQALAQ